MLTLRARNTFTDTNDIATYVVSIFANEQPIWNGEVTHDRKLGAGDLLRVIADAYERERKIA